jgi:hypothetical protein
MDDPISFDVSIDYSFHKLNINAKPFIPASKKSLIIEIYKAFTIIKNNPFGGFHDFISFKPHFMELHDILSKNTIDYLNKNMDELQDYMFVIRDRKLKDPRDYLTLLTKVFNYIQYIAKTHAA